VSRRAVLFGDLTGADADADQAGAVAGTEGLPLLDGHAEILLGRRLVAVVEGVHPLLDPDRRPRREDILLEQRARDRVRAGVHVEPERREWIPGGIYEAARPGVDERVVVQQALLDDTPTGLRSSRCREIRHRPARQALQGSGLVRLDVGLRVDAAPGCCLPLDLEPGGRGAGGSCQQDEGGQEQAFPVGEVSVHGGGTGGVGQPVPGSVSQPGHDAPPPK